MEGAASSTVIQILHRVLDLKASEAERHNALKVCCEFMANRGIDSYSIIPDGVNGSGFLPTRREPSDDHLQALRRELIEAYKTISSLNDEIGRLKESHATTLTPEKFLKAAKLIAVHEGHSEREWPSVMADILRDPRRPDRRRTELTIKQMTRNPLAKIAPVLEAELAKRQLVID